MRDDMTTWRALLTEEMEAFNDDGPVVAVAPDDSVLDVEFDGGYGGSAGKPVLVWTEQRVYFPVVYDGAEWLGSAPRNPRSQGQSHVGGQ